MKAVRSRRSPACFLLAVLSLLLAFAGLIATAGSSSAALSAKATPRPGIDRYLRPQGETADVTTGDAVSVPNGSDPGEFGYYGGPVMANGITVHTVYWDPGGRFTEVPAFQDGVDQFISDVAHDTNSTQDSFGVPREYFDGHGKPIKNAWQFGGRIVDTAPYPTYGGACVITPGIPCVTGPQEEAELKRLIADHHLATGLGQFYALLLPPGVDQCEHFANHYVDSLGEFNDCAYNPDNQIGVYCAYHGNAAMSTPQVLPPDRAIVWASIPYISSDPNCSVSPAGYPTDGGYEPTLVSLMHEMIESQTDPLVAEDRLGWYSPDLFEVADPCALSFGSELGSTSIGSYNQLINGRPYQLQEIWSNRAGGCVVRPPGAHTAAPHAAQQAPGVRPAAPGLTMTRAFAAAPAGVRAQVTAALAGNRGAAPVQPGSSPQPRSGAGFAESDTSQRLNTFYAPAEASAIGPSGLLEATQQGFALYDRSMHRRALVSTQEIAGLPLDFMSPAVLPDVSWDSSSGRFEYAMAALSADFNPADTAQRAADPDLLVYGFSRTANPSGFGADQWCTYFADTDTLASHAGDGIALLQPRVGHFDGHLVITGVLDDISSGDYGAQTVAVAPVPRPGTLATCPAAPVRFTGSEAAPLVNRHGTVPWLVSAVQASGPMRSGYLVSADQPFANGRPTADQIFLWKVDASGAVTTLPDVLVPDYTLLVDAPQAGSNALLGTNDSSFGKLVAHTWPGGRVSIYAAHADGPDPAAASFVRWYEIQPGATAPLQVGTISSPGEYLFDPSIAPNASGSSVALTYNESGSTLARVAVVSHTAGMPAGSVGPETVLATSTAPVDGSACAIVDGIGCAWGAYSSAATDPAGGSVWVTNEYNGPPDPQSPIGLGWQTVNAQVSVGY